MNRKMIVISAVSLCLFASGCGSSKVLLTKGQKTLTLKPNEGGVIFSLRSIGKDAYKAQNVTIQEINQYKHFKERKFIPVQSIANRARKDVNLFGLKLPKGTYRLAFFGGLKGFINFYIPCDKIIDVAQTNISYAGRVEVDTSPEAPAVTVVDRYEEDGSMFAESYPVLKSKQISKDLMY